MAYTIKEVTTPTDNAGEIITWGEGDRKKVDYSVILEGVNQPVILTQMVSSNPPEVGKEVNGDIDYNFWKGPKFNRSSDDYNKGGGGGGGGGGNSPPPEFWAAKDRAITRQHSQEMALRFLAATGEMAGADTQANQEVGTQLLNHLRRIADWFDTDVNGVAQWPTGFEDRTGRPNGKPAEPVQQQAPAANDDVPF